MHRHTTRHTREKPTDPARRLFAGSTATAGRVSANCRAGVVEKGGPAQPSTMGALTQPNQEGPAHD